jgi:hypothetical protein
MIDLNNFIEISLLYAAFLAEDDNDGVPDELRSGATACSFITRYCSTRAASSTEACCEKA